ncbi:MAG: HEAT repeat domain-containing protein [Candidatus Acidiferrales bacterium]
MDCRSVEERLPLYLCDELAEAERAELDAHLAGCAACAGSLAEMRRLHGALESRPKLEPSPDLLARCRLDLDKALDHETTGWRALIRSGFGLWPIGATFRVSTALAVLLVGFSTGWAVRQQTTPQPAPRAAEVNPWMGADLSGLRISGISRVTPDPQTGAVHITMDAERRLTLEGSVDDPRIQQVLLYAVKNYENPGIRHDTLEILRARSTDPVIREALLYALRHDPNDGVRLEALQAVRELAWSPGVRAAILEALQKDANPGVRVAAINALVEHADEDVLPALQEVAKLDSNPYVRMKCANAVRDLARGEF